MNILNMEVYSVVLVLIIALEYFISFKRQLNINFILFILMILCIISLSILNICFFYNRISSSNISLLLCLGYLILGILPCLLFIYIKINFFHKYHFLKKYIKNIAIYLLCYFIMIILYFLTNELDLSNNINHLLGSKSSSYVLFLSLLPLIFIMLEAIYRKVTIKYHFNYRILFAFTLPTIGLIFDVYFVNYSFVTASYVLAILSIYLYENDIVLNVDPLTGVYNRRMLTTKNFERRNFTNSTMAMYMIDVDKFKNINDTYGHDFGDKVLKDVSDIIKDSIRHTDYPIRIGGDEFLIIATVTDKKFLSVIPKKIKQSLKEYNKNNDMILSLSIGYDIYNRKESFNEFIKKIDSKMYHQKEKNHELLKTK